MTIKELYKLYQEHPCITTDSRNCPQGSIFLALKGDKFDGNQFAMKALEQGCAYAIVDKTAIIQNPELKVQSSKLIPVDDTLQTYKDLAREHRRQFRIPVIGITGTNGKTTTKELIATVLQQKYNVLYTQGNFNNDVGVPKTLFGLSKEHDIAVIEMGASHPGDIKTLAETAEPTCGLITNVGRAHLQGFGSFKNVVKTKGELYDFLGHRGESLVFINVDNDRLMDILPDTVWVAPYSTNLENVEGCTVGEVVSCAPFLKFRWRESDTNLEERGERGEEPTWYEVQTQLIGAYNIDNMMAAIAVGLNFGVEPADINRALEAYKPSNNRSQLTVTEHNHLIVDAYNANPSSMRAALDNFRLMEVSPKMAILGEMRELGNSSHKEHQKLVAQLAESGLDQIWLVGDEFTDLPSSYRHFHNVEEVKAAIAERQPQGYYILIKGSNSTRLYQLPELL
ncbi:MAG: UDP-N-acetylmuramoyl-tripeptide--D-alanyl-D-alanine ligase [Prevotella sp.]|nr:UDP-N-acetylmuramoyl-tripeptide--D-alanyl-D-alanine ligase [Prevotella sp.]